MRFLSFLAAFGLFLLAPCTLSAAPQVPADVVFGQTCYLRDSVAITLESAKYSVERVNIGTATYFPQAGEKLLILHFRVQNPGKDTLSFDAGTVPFSDIDAAGVTHKSVQDVGLEPTHETAEFDLKPGETKDNLYSVVITSAVGQDSALLIEAGRQGIEEEFLRCPLAGKVLPLPAPFANSSDRSGATALRSISASAGVFYPLALLNARLHSFSYTMHPLGGSVPDEGQRYFTAIFTVQNKSADKHGISGMNFAPVLRDTSGKSVEYNQTLLQPAADVSGDVVLNAGAEVSVRFFWSLPIAGRVQTLSLTEGLSRSYVFDVAGAK